MNTLVVDDNKVIRKMLCTILEGLSECDSVDTGLAAVEAFKIARENSTPYDLILLDISMPDMDGTEVLYEIRDIETKKNVPDEKRAKIIMVSAHSDKDTVITSIQAGCDDYIKKPLKKDIILQKLKDCGLDLHVGK